jgi:hypothetical protein
VPLSALDEVDAATWVQGKGFSQDQRPPGARLRSPASELEQFGRHPDQRDDADQDAGNEQYTLRGHLAARLADDSISVSIGHRKVAWTERICRLVATRSGANGRVPLISVIKE